MCPKVVLIAVSVASLLVPASAEETVPYALRTDKSGDTYVPSLGDIMGATQLRHFKLWYAGKLKNWELAGYELGRGDQNIPIENIIIVEKSLQALDSAIKDKDGEHFDNAFTDLTAACNSCHRAGQLGFIVIQMPTASPFSNQDFEPKQR
jgi:hypothetical protein